MTSKDALLERLANETLRKLHLATEAEQKEDRDIICEEIFTDLTGSLDSSSKAELGMERDCCFYEVIAPYFSRKWHAGESLLLVCKRLLSQPYVLPIYALLLYQWLLLNKDAGGAEQRQKHINLLVSGVCLLLWGDVHSSRLVFQPLYGFLAEQVVLSPGGVRLQRVPPGSRAKLLGAVATFLPYYTPPQDLARLVAGFPNPGGTASSGGVPHREGEGADFVILEVTEALKQMRAEGSLIRYLVSLGGLKRSPFLARCRQMTRLRLQGELYSLTQAGGPRGLTRNVNAAAFQLLDQIFPSGAWSRRLVSFVFRLTFHPGEWLYTMMAAVRRSARLTWASVCYVGSRARFWRGRQVPLRTE